MNVVKIFGGVGNQLFQYALYRKIKKQEECYVDLGWFEDENKKFWYPYQINDLGLEANAIDRKDYIVKEYYLQNQAITENEFEEKLLSGEFCGKQTLRLVSETPTYAYSAYEKSKEAYLVGYFQNIDYFKDVLEEIKDEVRFPIRNDAEYVQMKERIETSNSVSIHIRLNDYESIEDFEEVCPISYYVKAIQYIKEHIKTPHFFIFSNKIEEAKKRLPVLGDYTYVDIHDRTYGIGDMELISLCKHNIISNSTFSWWATVFNKNQRKLVIAPNKWDIRPRALLLQSEINLWFEDWIRIEG